MGPLYEGCIEGHGQQPISRRPQTFRQGDLVAAIRAAKATGLEVARMEIGIGKIVLVMQEVH